jgi:plasmid stabilization system protein ParE
VTSIRIRFHEFALDEVSAAERYYSSRSVSLGLEFIDALDHALARLRAFPESGAPHLRGTRRLLLERFPFAVIYTLEENHVVIVAVAHQRRKPGYWRRR